MSYPYSSVTIKPCDQTLDSMAFKSPSYIPQLPFDPPETLPVHEFLFGGSEKFGRHPIGDSKPPFTCGISGKAHSAQEVAERIELLARALATRFGWKVNEGNELDKVTCVYSLNTVSIAFPPFPYPRS